MNVLINNHRFYLREATLEDVDGMFSLEQKVSPLGWSYADFVSSVSSSHHCQLLFSSELGNDKLMAYIITSTAADEAELLNIVVSPEYQRQGIASQLLALAFRFFDKHIHSLFLEVRESNKAAYALYDRLGFHEVGIRPNYYPAISKNGSITNPRENAIIMAKVL